MAYTQGRVISRDADPRYDRPIQRNELGGNYDFSQNRPGLSVNSRRDYSGRRGVEQEHQTMDTDDSDIKVTSMFKNTEELIASIEGLSSLVEKSKDELKAVDELKLKPSIDSQSISDEMQKIKTENEIYRNEFEKLRQKYKEEFDQRSKLEQIVKHSKVDQARLAKECDALKLQLSQSREKNKTIENEKKEVVKELSESKTRLSRLMGNKLADNNPDIADLSDKNRPTKLAERYAELYDNEWTDAFEAFEESCHSEQKSIRLLLFVLEHIKKHCDKMAQDQADKLESAVVVRTYEDGQIPDYVSKQLKDFRRSTAEVAMPEIYKSYIAEANNSRLVQFMSDERVKLFVNGCVELCWLMTVQDPPIVFGPKPQTGDVFDTNVYKHYTKTGASIDFLVWPTLHLHEGGAMLCKGVAQGFASGRSRSREGERLNTAAAIRESVEDHPQAAPPAQNIDRDDKARFGQTFASSSPENKHWLSQHNQNYQQQVITGANIPAKSQFSSTVKDTTGNHPGIPLHKNWSSSVKTEGNVYRKSRPDYPGKDAMSEFYSVVYKYGAESQKVKDRLGEKYYECVDYYNYYYSKT